MNTRPERGELWLRKERDPGDDGRYWFLANAEVRADEISIRFASSLCANLAADLARGLPALVRTAKLVQRAIRKAQRQP